MRERELNGKDRRHLRALAHGLKPLVQIGQQGLTEGVVRATDEALTTHELVKVRVMGESEDELGEIGVRLATKTRSHLAQVIGRMLLLYRRRKNKPGILFPGEKPPRVREASNLKRTASKVVRKRRSKAARAKKLSKGKKREA